MSATYKLLPCPFCGGKAVLHEMRYGEGGQCSVFGVFCATDAKAEYQHGHFIDNFATEADAIAAWNMRAERTCAREKHGVKMDGSPRLRCSLCGYGIGDKRFNYCPKCGAKVVSE